MTVPVFEDRPETVRGRMLYQSLLAVHALIRRDRVIYCRDGRPQTRVAPVVGPGVGGAVVSVTW